MIWGANDMLSLILSLLVVSAGVAYIFLAGITKWWQKELVPGFLYITTAIMVILITCVYSVVLAMSSVIEENIQKHGADVTLEQFMPKNNSDSNVRK